MVATVGSDGKVDFYNGSAGSVQVVADVSGWFAAGAPGPGGYAGLRPARIVDSRAHLGVSQALGARQTGYVKPILGRGGLPLSGVGAVVLNVTVTQPTSTGYLSVFKDTYSPPRTSNLNFSAGQTVANLVVVPMDSSNGIDFYNSSAGSVQVIADVEGWVATPTQGGGGLFGLSPLRLMDTRLNLGAAGPVGPGRTATLVLSGRGGLPAAGAAGVGVMLNVTVTQPKAAGYLTVYPHGSPLPHTSNVNFVAGETIPNMVITGVGPDGDVSVFDGSSGSVQIVADVYAWIAPGTGTIPWAAPHEVDPVEGHPNSVSCNTPRFCVAVDASGNAITFDGSTWSPPTPIDPNGGGLNSVSCPATTFCAAVDAAGNVLTYNGTTWSPPTAIDPDGEGVTAVSCATPSRCVALSSRGDMTTYDGTNWSAPVLHQVPDAMSLSCPTVDFCGALIDNGSQVETYDDTTWTLQPQLGGTPPGHQGGIACTYSTFCVVAAWTNADIFDGAQWTPSGPIDPAGLSAVSCTSSASCMAVDPSGNALSYDGHTWTSPVNIDPNGQRLTSLSCPMATTAPSPPDFCVAVDASGNALAFNGTGWSSPLMIDPAGGAPERGVLPDTSILHGRRRDW